MDLEKKDSPSVNQHSYPTDEEKTLTIVMHILSAFFGIISPLIFYCIYTEKRNFVFVHTKSSLNVMISTIIYWIGIFIVGALTFGIGFLLFLPLAFYPFVYIIIACIKASESQTYDFPLTIRFFK